MSNRKPKHKTYDVSVKVVVDTTISITASSYEEALTKARELGVRDVVEFDTDFNNGSVAITGVYNFSEENHK